MLLEPSPQATSISQATLWAHYVQRTLALLAKVQNNHKAWRRTTEAQPERTQMLVNLFMTTEKRGNKQS